ncbi:MAG: hypothetical protein ABIH34_00465 [Nanoarchaeota archaeon]
MKALPLVVLCMLFLAACSASTSIKSMFSRNPTIFAEGDGLEMRFIQSMPPELVEMETKFPIGLEIKNTGKTDIKNGNLVLVNYYPQFISTEETHYIIGDREPFRGVSEYYPNGDFEIVTFNAESLALHPTDQEKEVLFKVYGCYAYETRASASICINTDKSFFSSFGDVCQVADVNMPRKQGAPIAVTKIEETIYDVDKDNARLQLIINIQNFGNGKITARNAVQKECLGEAVLSSNINNIITEIRLGKDLIESTHCKSPEIDPHEPDKMQIFCSKDIPKTQSAFTTPITVILSYGYITPDLFKEITIKANSPDYPCKGTCIPDDAFVCEAYGGLSYGSCPMGSQCCERSTPECEDLKGISYGCFDKNVCQTDKISNMMCPGTEVCCVPSDGPCSPNRCKTENQCNNGYGGVDPLHSCNDDLVCCNSDVICKDFIDDGNNTYRCFQEDNRGYATCQDEQKDMCAGDEKCCRMDSPDWARACEAEANGKCVKYESWKSCEAFGGAVAGQCGSDAICCKREKTECEVNHEDSFSASQKSGEWTCISKIKAEEFCDPDQILGTKPGGFMCTGQDTCCQIKHSCETFHKDDWGNKPGMFACLTVKACTPGTITHVGVFDNLSYEPSCGFGTVCCQRPEEPPVESEESSE